MQVTQAAAKNLGRVGVEEELIKFRPSPNFKNMKKFLKSRSDYYESSMVVNQAVAAVVVEPKPSLDRKELKPVIVQPPLPPYPPPPDSPPNLNVVIKQEKLDDEVQNTSGNEGEIPHEPQPILENRLVEQTGGRPNKTICKEFIRGNCKRPLCKYAHEVDVSQLSGVFTFCWNYQNAVCTFPNCRFVHASVFEEAEFYRTGVLPPHARNHLKNKQVPPPPPPPIEEAQPEIRASNFLNPPPIHTNVENTLPVISCVPASAIEQRPDENYRAADPRSISPLKREWTEIEDFSSSPRDLDVNEHLAKKCKNCEFLDFSTKYHKEMMHNLIQSSEEINKKISLLNKKSLKLHNVLITLWKSATTKTADKENNSVMEQLNNFIGANNRIGSSSANNDDSLKNVFSLMGERMVGGTTGLSSLMKLLCSAGDQNLTANQPRDIVTRDLHRVSEGHLPVGLVYLNDAPERFVCNSLLLKDKWSVAPGHCVAMRTDPDLYNLLMSWRIKYQSSGEKFFESRIKRTIPHPHFDRDDFRNNVGLLEHEDSVKMNYYIFPSVISMSDETLQVHENHLALVGWMHNATGHRDEPLQLRRYEVAPVPTTKCVQFMAPILDLRIYEYCVRLHQKDDFDYPEHGSVFVVDANILGFFGWGEKSGKGAPCIVIDLRHFKEWLENIIAW